MLSEDFIMETDILVSGEPKVDTIKGEERSETQTQRTKRKRKFDKEKSRWTQSEKKKYLKFFLISQIKDPRLIFSFYNWKVQIYPKIAEYIGTKSARQIKSHCQRMKNIWAPKGKDIMDMVKQELRAYEQDDPEITQLKVKLQELSKEPSQHMLMIRKQMHSLQESKNDILNLKMLLCSFNQKEQNSIFVH